jgi:phasin family protein
MANFDSVPTFGKEQFEAVSAAAAAVTKGWQSIAAETTDYSKKSFEKSRLLAEKLITVKKLDEAFALQSDFAKSAYEDFVAEATKLGEMYAALTKEAFKPIESATKSFTPAE